MPKENILNYEILSLKTAQALGLKHKIISYIESRKAALKLLEIDSSEAVAELDLILSFIKEVSDEDVKKN